ncbi:S-methyl-5-thioribose kinase [Bacillus canaveralius]|uniref:Methylthioribose kinase n=1 Tax=Bacillus canaveralius TaxID=1403243 RepID=A0A2N5GL02_9BACI|nr:S-methyl-5-thioribose kinase [Bacillus canaveralius]PLR82150.1 S-methyl-5-thioribose kinase [Bacillus canaveralius]PLR97944.1 S-methyl-5-thioribose kinase [Bacillus canaveralius]
MVLLQNTTYEPLTESSAAALAIRLRLFPEGSVLTVSEIGDGNLNLVFRISDHESGQSVIIKQALPYAKVVGESWPLTLKRATIEANALSVFKKLAPNYVPEVFFSDEIFAITVMEDLSHLTIARTGLIQGEDFPLLPKHIGEYLAKTLFFTSDYGLKPAEKKELVGKFINPELCKITEDLIFTDPFFDAPTNDFEEGLRKDAEKLWADEELKLEAALLKKSFLTETESLLHGDLHTGSIFANNDETKVIDPEFAFYGPAGFDLGQVVANLLFQQIANPEKQRKTSSQIRVFWKTFSQEYSKLWKEQNTDPLSSNDRFLAYLLEKYLQDAAGFAGCELIRRTVGLSHVADLDGIQDKVKRLDAKRTALQLGSKFIKNHRTIKSIEDLIG